MPLHNSPLNTPSTPSMYPPLHKTWNRLRAWLAREYPELGDTLNYGILPQDLAQIEMQFGVALPSAVRESYLVVDGQEAESAAGCSEGLFFGLTLLPLEDVLEEWRFWREVDDDPTTGANPRLREGMQSIPNGWVRKEYSQRGWIPLIVDKAGNYIGVDINPGEEGSVGQVIVFGRDFDTKVVLWKGDGPDGWARWLASFVDELESGEGYELGSGGDSEGSEDGLGYEGYYYDGTGRGQGDGGGDTSSGGGLRLTGEYKGWTVLEAWADRSVRKWYEAGVINGASLLLPETEKGKVCSTLLSTIYQKLIFEKSSQKPGLGILNLAKNDGNSAAEVIMPVLADDDENDESLGSGEINVPSIPPPTISITKPPLPQPVSVPTAHDIVSLPSPPDSTHSSLDGGDRAGDLESGRRMHQVPHSSSVTARKPSRSSTPANSTEESTAKAGDSPALVPVTPSPNAQLPSPSTVSDVTNLLDDAAPPMDNIPIEPTSPTPSIVELARKETLDAHVEAGDSSTAATKEEDSDTIVNGIRLVGGGGTAGVAKEEIPTDAESVRYVTSNDSTAKGDGAKKHKRGLSSGLKKIVVGGKRKKDSSGSIKEKETGQ